MRNSELSGIQIGHLRVHDLHNARVDIPDSKTETGIRNVEISPYLAEVLIEHIDRLRKAGFDTGPTAPLFPNERGKRMSRKRVGVIVHEAAVLATEKMRERGLPPLAHITPHSLRRTYITIALLANKYDIKWVMDQVGHADSKMTMDVYNQLQQRAKREHGASFDRLIREARVALVQRRRATVERGVWAGKTKTTPNRPSPRRPERGQKLKNWSLAGRKPDGGAATQNRGNNVFSGGATNPSRRAGGSENPHVCWDFGAISSGGRSLAPPLRYRRIPVDTGGFVPTGRVRGHKPQPGCDPMLPTVRRPRESASVLHESARRSWCHRPWRARGVGRATRGPA